MKASKKIGESGQVRQFGGGKKREKGKKEKLTWGGSPRHLPVKKSAGKK